jgi:hypothetical protein
MFEFKRPLLVSVFIIVTICLIIQSIKLIDSDYTVKQISNFNFNEIIVSLEVILLISIVVGYNLYKFSFPTFDIETMIEHDKYLIS